MAKTCPDCDTNNPDSAVTCSECGSLFAEMVGTIEAADDDSAAAGPADLETAGARRRECGNCGATVATGRCARCGSSNIVFRAAGAPVQAARTAARPAAAKPRPAPALEQPDAPHVSLTVLAALAAVKLFLEIPLGASLLAAREGSAVLSPVTLRWRFLLGGALFVAALSGAGGAYGAYFLRRWGVVLLAVSYAVDLALAGWLTTFVALGDVPSEYGVGLYVFLATACLVAIVELAREATRDDLL